MSANFELQKSIFETLAGNAAVVSLLGGPHIHEQAPRDARFPYITFGQTSVRDWSTGTESGLEHIVTLHVWSRSGGKKQVEEIIAAMNAALGEAVLSLNGHALINLRFEFADARRDPDGETLHGIVRYRAVSEPLN